MNVNRFPSNPGAAGWNAILPEQASPRVLEGNITADWLVIGAGFAGLSAALRLLQTRPGEKIVVLDALRIAEGTVGRNSGFMIDLPHDLTSDDYGGQADADRAIIARNRRAIGFARDAVERFAMPEEAFRETGKINAAATPKGSAHNREYAEHLASLGEPSEMLDATQMKALTGIGYYESGLFTPGTVILQPALYARGFAEGLRREGAQIFETSPVTGLDRTGPDWRATTPKGSVTAPKVVLATNGHVQSFGFFRGRLIHTYTYASMTRPLSGEESAHLGGSPDWGITPADPLGTTVRRVSGTGGDRIVIRNRFTYEAGMRVPDRRLPGIWRDHDKSFAARFPMLHGVKLEHRWGGHLCLAMNNVPAFGEIDTGLYAAACQNGLGTVQGTFAGIMAADLATGTESADLKNTLALPKPNRLPPEPIAAIGATARIRWGEWKAGREL